MKIKQEHLLLFGAIGLGIFIFKDQIWDTISTIIYSGEEPPVGDLSNDMIDNSEDAYQGRISMS